MEGVSQNVTLEQVHECVRNLIAAHEKALAVSGYSSTAFGQHLRNGAGRDLNEVLGATTPVRASTAAKQYLDVSTRFQPREVPKLVQEPYAIVKTTLKRYIQQRTRESTKGTGKTPGGRIRVARTFRTRRAFCE